MDLVLKLRELRRMRGLTQQDVARLSGVGEKTISSFETGDRIGSIKLVQLERLLAAYGLTEAEFFGGMIEKELAPWELDGDEMAMRRLLDDLHALSKPVQRNLLAKFQLMVETVLVVYGEHENGLPRPDWVEPQPRPVERHEEHRARRDLSSGQRPAIHNAW